MKKMFRLDDPGMGQTLLCPRTACKEGLKSIVARSPEVPKTCITSATVSTSDRPQVKYCTGKANGAPELIGSWHDRPAKQDSLSRGLTLVSVHLLPI